MLMQEGAPIYVKVEEYKEVLDIIGLVKEKIGEADLVLNQISEIKSKEDIEIANWKSSLEDVKIKVSNIDKNLLDVKSI
jgi:hypothetical protein